MEPKITISDAAEILRVTPQAVHSTLKKKNLHYKKSKNRVYFGHDTAKHIFNFKFKPQTISIQIVKGGTGKTTIVHSIASRASLYGANILCIDLDQQANLTRSFGRKGKDQKVIIDVLTNECSIQDAIINVCPGVDLLCSSLKNARVDNFIMLEAFKLDDLYKDLIEPVRNNYDLIIFDCPPAIGQSVSSATLASDYIITPVNPDEFCLDGLEIVMAEIKAVNKKYKKNIKLKILMNKFDSRTILSDSISTELYENYKDLMFKSIIGINQDFPNVIAKGVSIFDSPIQKESAKDIDLVVREILDIS